MRQKVKVEREGEAQIEGTTEGRGGITQHVLICFQGDGQRSDDRQCRRQ